ncbi:hypothetical protein I553_5635 [Mycobacterium xenopi 4042]|uniref:Uncharacterized protein n=1 Tax=Mycobacterium xenopi 4042 TaxID=1299334 RepID=X7ZWL4_MYCXE|nr:hypothetical protein I553_5635 [Mycobacterium xenopi 4042]
MDERPETDALHDSSHRESASLSAELMDRDGGVDHRRLQMTIRLLPESAIAKRSPRKQSP